MFFPPLYLKTQSELVRRTLTLLRQREEGAARTAALERENASLVSTNAALERSRALAEAEHDKIREAYREASEVAAARGSEAAALERKLDSGMRQLQVFYAANQKAAEAEIGRLKNALELLHERERRTNATETREKAARADELERILKERDEAEKARRQREREAEEQRKAKEAEEAMQREPASDESLVCLWRDESGRPCSEEFESRMVRPGVFRFVVICFLLIDESYFEQDLEYHLILGHAMPS
jgi:colicin import membrane protein